jgi:hypothetical protein
MIFDEKKFPILKFIENNIMTEFPKEILDNSGYDDKNISDLRNNILIFLNKQLQINYISTSIHEKLLDTSNFIKAKTLLSKSTETAGLLLLPETIYPDFANVPDYVTVNPKEYPINAILYIWLSNDNYDKLEGTFDKELSFGEDGRTIAILPIFNGKITQATDTHYLQSNNETYGDRYNENDREWYGKILDYVMSFILFYNYTDTEVYVINGDDSRQSAKIKLNNEKYLNYTKNNVEIIDASYFTKIIRTDEFGVKGHFRLQHFGANHSQSKIIFVEDYKKTGYTREAKINK